MPIDDSSSFFNAAVADRPHAATLRLVRVEPGKQFASYGVATQPGGFGGAQRLQNMCNARRRFGVAVSPRDLAVSATAAHAASSAASTGHKPNESASCKARKRSAHPASGRAFASASISYSMIASIRPPISPLESSEYPVTPRQSSL